MALAFQPKLSWAVVVIAGVFAHALNQNCRNRASVTSFEKLRGILVCGLSGLKNQKLGVHIALVVAIWGIFGTGTNVMQIRALIDGEAQRPAAVVTSIITFVLVIVSVIMGVRPFISARRWKDAAQAEPVQR